MYNDLYTKQYKKPELHIDLDVSKFLMIIITVVGFFVLPAITGTYLIKQNELNSKNPNESVQVADTETTGKVAGVSTSSEESINIIGIDFAKKQNQLIGLGVIFVLLSITTVLYLLGLDSQKEPYTKSDVVW